MDLIQNLLKQIATYEWPELFVSKILDNSQCSKILFHVNFLDNFCLKLAISKSLGYVMIFAACFYKVPIILKILKAKGGDGLSIFSLYLETSSYLATLFYNVFRQSPISTYGDLCSAIGQNFIIILLVWYYGMKNKTIKFTHIVFMISLLGIFTSVIYAIPTEKHSFIVSYGIIIILFSRIPQIASNFITGNVGVQSLITLTNSVLGAGIKVFITIVETADIFLIGGAALSFCFNTVLFSQVLYLQTVSRTQRRTLILEANTGIKTVTTNPSGVEADNQKVNTNSTLKKRE